MSHRTVQRAILEGGIASDIQLAHDVGKLKRLPDWAIAQFVALPKN